MSSLPPNDTPDDGAADDGATGPGEPIPVAGENGGTYEVGYGKPPVAHRFPPGQSGNPRGRPKARKSLEVAIREAFTEPISIKKGKKERRVPKGAAIIEVHAQNALRGSAPALRALMPLLLAAAARDGSSDSSAPLTEEERSLLEKYLAHRFGPGRGEGDVS